MLTLEPIVKQLFLNALLKAIQTFGSQVVWLIEAINSRLAQLFWAPFWAVYTVWLISDGGFWGYVGAAATAFLTHRALTKLLAGKTTANTVAPTISDPAGEFVAGLPTDQQRRASLDLLEAYHTSKNVDAAIEAVSKAREEAVEGLKAATEEFWNDGVTAEAYAAMTDAERRAYHDAAATKATEIGYLKAAARKAGATTKVELVSVGGTVLDTGVIVEDENGIPTIKPVRKRKPKGDQ